MSISHIDHIVLTVKDIPITLEFYARVLGMHAIQFGSNNQTPRIALKFGNQKINLHEAGKEFEPKALNATPGSADLCLITEEDIDDAMAYVKSCGVDIIDGPVKRTGARGDLLSFYFRDPDFKATLIN
ncbi:MAG: VOC family protein, partial [Gammaproteobacteria bacterium]|nr:VOC family protein [Gammaproteobacteria bacterium]